MGDTDGQSRPPVKTLKNVCTTPPDDVRGNDQPLLKKLGIENEIETETETEMEIETEAESER